MPQPFLFATSEGVLHCPLCGDTYVHVDTAHVAGRPREDGRIVPVSVDEKGHVSTPDEGALPIPDVGRRHAISLGAWCEICGGRFSVEFKQHKGQTMVSVRRAEWVKVEHVSDPS